MAAVSIFELGRGKVGSGCEENVRRGYSGCKVTKMDLPGIEGTGG